MGGIRLYSPILSEETYDPDLLLLADKDGLPQPVVVPMKYVGNTLVEGGTDLINWELPLLDTHTKIRFSSDGGDNWNAFTIPTASGTRDLLETLTGNNRLDVDFIKDVDDFIDTQNLDHLETNHIDTSIISYHYWGDRTTEGSWRIGVEDGNMVFQRRELTIWETKLRLSKTINIALSSGAFALSGGNINVTKTWNAGLSSGAFTLSGGDLEVTKTWYLELGSGSFAVSGGDLTVTGP